MSIYNPSDYGMDIEFDGEKKQVMSQKYWTINMSPGIHHVTSSIWDSTILDVDIEVTEEDLMQGGIINVSNEEMFLVTEKYATDDAYLMDYTPAFMVTLSSEYVLDENNAEELEKFKEGVLEEQGLDAMMGTEAKSILLDSFLIVGFIDVFHADQYVIQKTWDYGPGEKFPNGIEMETDGLIDAMGVNKKKLFSRREIILYYLANYSLGSYDL